jgi:hypothetical protein
VKDQLEVKAVMVGDRARQHRSMVSRNREEAERQRHHRQDLDRLDPQVPEHTKRACELVASKRYGRSLARGPSGRLAINTVAVRRAERMDGNDVLLTNDATLTPEDVGLG